MRQGRVMACGIAESLEGRHLHDILRDILVGNGAAMPDRRSGARGKSLGAVNGVSARRWLGLMVFGQAVDLLDIEDHVALEERNGIFGFLAGRGGRLGADDFVGIDNEAAMLALAHVGL
jgi:hypothetical protein